MANSSSLLSLSPLKLSLIFSPISHSVLVNRETSSSCFFRVFLCIFCDRKFEFQVVLFIFLLHWSHGDHHCDESKNNTWKCQWSRLLPWFLQNKLDSAFIWNQQLFIKIYHCTRCLKGTLRLIETWLLFGKLRQFHWKEMLPCNHIKCQHRSLS